MLKKIWISIFCLLLAVGPAAAQEYDGLKLLGKGGTMIDKLDDSTMTLLGFEGKYDEKVVGVYITQHGTQVRFYMDAVTWDKLKQTLVKARDQWETLSPTQFADNGAVRGFRVGNIRSTMTVSMTGKTELDNKRLAFSLNGGGNTPKRVYISLDYGQVKTLVNELYQVDEILRN